MSDIAQALIALRPGAKWSVDGNSYGGITWLDAEQSQPTEAEIEAEMARLQANYDAQEYARKRAAEYPPIGDQPEIMRQVDAGELVIQEAEGNEPLPADEPIADAG